MTSTTIGQVVIVEGRRAVVCKRYDLSRPRFGVIFFDDNSGHLLHEDEWIVTGETISRAKAEKLFAAYDRAAQKHINVEQERRLRRLRDRGI